MKLLNIFKQVIAGFVQAMFKQWWVEITTADPQCTYYFGPFNSSLEARKLYSGYVEDLEGEGAQGITVTIKLCKPEILTFCGSGVEF
ncbi:DUF1816 domain-containing protein [Phormidesmis priestleyi]